MYLYVYDCHAGASSNARRVAFTKELYGVRYSWKTKDGVRERNIPGIIDLCAGTEIVTDSAILVPDECRAALDALFERYRDVVYYRVFRVLGER
ncbi:MAG: hypothetical protein QXQ81_01565 [Candidatus Thorarchaeota archaeon]